MAQFLADVEQEIEEAGGIDALRPRFNECTEKGSHHWRELRTTMSPDTRIVNYCEDCKVVNIHGYITWLLPPSP